MEWKIYEDSFNKKTQEKIEWLDSEFNKIRTGRASPSILDGILVDYFGTPTKIMEIANIRVADAKQLVIKSYESSSLKTIANAIAQSNIGISPIIDSDIIRLNFPSPTEESRKLLIKKSKEYAEQAKIGIRNSRKDIHNQINKDDELTKDDLRYFVEMLDKAVKVKNSEIDKILDKKEKDLMVI